MMTESNDYEWLLARERGEDVSHVPAETRAKYGQLDRLIKELPAHAPSPGWKQRVLDSLDDPLEARRPRAFPSATARSPVATAHSAPAPRRRWWAFGPGVAATFAAAFALCVYVNAQRQSHGPDEAHIDEGVASLPSHRHVEPADVPLSTGVGPPGVTVSAVDQIDGQSSAVSVASTGAAFTALAVGSSSVDLRRRDRARRGLVPTLGDTLIIETISERPIELRAYGDAGEPLARCTETQGCRVVREGDRRRYHFEIEVRSLGALHTVAYPADTVPRSSVSLEADLEAAQRANAEVKEISIVHVE